MGPGGGMLRCGLTRDERLFCVEEAGILEPLRL